MAQTVIGMFESSSKAQEAVQELVDAGIKRDRIDVSSNSSSNSSYSSSSVSDNDGNESGVSKFFKSLFGDNDDADKYTRVASGAQSIVTVHAQSGDEAERVADILDDNGAVDVDEHASKMGYNTGAKTSGTDYMAGSTVAGAATDYTGTTGYTGTNRTNDTTADQTNKIPVIEESLAVGKREVETGGVRLRSRIVERPVEEAVRLREEHVNVERTTVDRPATAADFENFKERDVEMVERAEVPVVSKEARVVEEVSIGKEVEERSETISDTVRKTEVDVEDLDKKDLKDRYSNNS
jgi:uncharacterized protein (TIGR02271 family)